MQVNSYRDIRNTCLLLEYNLLRKINKKKDKKHFSGLFFFKFECSFCLHHVTSSCKHFSLPDTEVNGAVTLSTCVGFARTLGFQVVDAPSTGDPP